MLVFVLTGPGHIVFMMRIAGPDDFVLAMSFRRGLRSTAEGFKEARSKKSSYFDLTNASISPIARFSGEYFVASIESESLRCSCVAPFAFAEVLISVCADILRGRIMKLLDDPRIEQRHAYRLYED